MKKLSKNIKRALILTAFSCASVYIMPNIFYDVMPVCTASEVSASDALPLTFAQENISQEMMEAFKIADYQQNAEAGDIAAQRRLAYTYYSGNGIKQDNEKAFHWWQKAAEQGDAVSQFNLALCYDNGIGTKQNRQKAVHWFTAAAEQGLPEAQTNLAYH